MALEDIKNKIIADAKNQAKEIISNAQNLAQDAKKQAANELDEQKKRELSSAKINIKNQAKSLLIRATIDGKNQVLTQKRTIIDKILTQTLERLKNLPDNQYAQIIKSSLNQLPALNLTDITIIPSLGKSSLIKSLAKEALKEKKPVIADEDKKISGGFWVKSGATIIDFSFGNLLAEIKPVIEKKINTALLEDR